MFIGKISNDQVLIDLKNMKYRKIDLDFVNFNWKDNFDKGEWISDENLFKKLIQPPIEPSKIICVGKNYEAHAKEMKSEVPKEPLLFQKPPSSLIGHNDKIIIPEMSKQVEHETELVIVIKKFGKNISLGQAMDYVFGYTIGLDITARDLQKSDKTWFRGKGFDTFAPLGPFIVPPTNIALNDCSVKLFVNGVLQQSGNTKDMIYSVPFIISYVSKIVSLYPGDLIFTGTPEGVGQIKSGDILEAQIDNIGSLIVSVQ